MSSFVIRDYEHIAEAPQRAWDAFMQDSSATIFYRKEWLQAFESATVEHTLTRRYFTLQEGDLIVAALPTYLMRFSPFWHGYEIDANQDQVFSGSWLAAPSIYSFTGGIPCVDVYDSQVLADMLLQEVLRFADEQGGQALGLLNIPKGAPLLNHLISRADATVFLDTNHVLDLPCDFETYLKSLPKHVRDDFKRRCRRATDKGVIGKVVKSAGGSVDLARFHALTIEATEKHGIAPLYNLPTLGTLADLPCTSFLLCLHGDDLLGGFLFFEDDKTVYVWCAAIDYSRIGEFSTYIFLMSEIMSYAYGSGKQRVEFGRGNYSFKRKHGFQGIPLYSLFFVTSHADPALAKRLAMLHDNLVLYVERQGGVVSHATS